MKHLPAVGSDKRIDKNSAGLHFAGRKTYRTSLCISGDFAEFFLICAIKDGNDFANIIGSDKKNWPGKLKSIPAKNNKPAVAY